MTGRGDIARRLDALYDLTGAERWFDPPFFGVAAASDPWFERYKTIIGPHHWTPREALKLVHPEAEARSVIVWILPVRETVRAANRAAVDTPAREWAAMRSFGELANETIGAQLRKLLENAGYPTVDPHPEQLRRGFKIGPDFTSHWSERHAAFVAGLGTFGLSAGLITRRGIAHRIGSVVTTLELVPDPRPYGDDPWAWCTRCGACLRRCPAHAIGDTPEKRDKAACAAYARDHILPDRAERYGWLGLNLGCGLCQTGVPCEFQKP